MQGSGRVGRGLKVTSLTRQLKHHNLAPTPSVIINVRRFSLTFKKLSASISVRREFSIDVVSVTATPSHSSSTSREDRNAPVVSSTWDSTMKKPEISWVRVGRDVSGRGVGRMRPDWACYTVTGRHLLLYCGCIIFVPFCQPGMISGVHSESQEHYICGCIQIEAWSPHAVCHCQVHQLRIFVINNGCQLVN